MTQLITTKQLALRLHKTPVAFRMLRHRGLGPRGVRVGRDVLYAEADVQAWLAAKTDADPLAQRAMTSA